MIRLALRYPTRAGLALALVLALAWGRSGFLPTARPYDALSAATAFLCRLTGLTYHLGCAA